MKYFESKNALFCRNFYQIDPLFLKNPACKIVIFISQNLFHKKLNNLLEKRLPKAVSNCRYKITNNSFIASGI